VFQHSGMPSATAYRAVLAPRNTPPNDLECRWVVKRSVISPAVGIGAEPGDDRKRAPSNGDQKLDSASWVVVRIDPGFGHRRHRPNVA
jgi:hypothetical protein